MSRTAKSIAMCDLALLVVFSAMPAIAADQAPIVPRPKACGELTILGIFGVGSAHPATASDCQRYVEMAKADVHSALASLDDEEYETAIQLAAEAADMIAKAIRCELASCAEASRSSSCQSFLEDASEKVQSGFRNVGNHQFGDAADDFGQALGALSTWLSCVHDACME